MKKLFFILLTILSSAAAGASYFYLSGKMAFCFAFLCGALSGIFLMNIFIEKVNGKSIKFIQILMQKWKGPSWKMWTNIVNQIKQ